MPKPQSRTVRPVRRAATPSKGGAKSTVAERQRSKRADLLARRPEFPLRGRLRGVERGQLPLLGFLGAALLAGLLLVGTLAGGSSRAIAGWPGLRPTVPAELAAYPDAAYVDGQLYLPSSTVLRGTESLDAGWLVSDLVSAAREEIEALIAEGAARVLESASPSASTSTAAESTPSAGAVSPSPAASGGASGAPVENVEIDSASAARLTWIANGESGLSVTDGPLAERLRALAEDRALRERATFRPAERVLLLQIDAGAAVEGDAPVPTAIANVAQRALYRDGYAPFGCAVLEGTTLSSLRPTLAATLRGEAFSADGRRVALLSRPLLADEPDPCTAGRLNQVPERETRLTALRCERLTPDCAGKPLAGVTARAYPIDPDRPESPPRGADPAATAVSDAQGGISLTLRAGGWVIFFDAPTTGGPYKDPEPGFWLLDLRGQASNPLTVRFGAE